MQEDFTNKEMMNLIEMSDKRDLKQLRWEAAVAAAAVALTVLDEVSATIKSYEKLLYNTALGIYNVMSAGPPKEEADEQA